MESECELTNLKLLSICYKPTH